MKSRDTAKTRLTHRAAARTVPAGSSELTRTPIRAVPRRSGLEPLFEGQRRFELTRETRLDAGGKKRADGWLVRDAAGEPLCAVAAREGAFWKSLGQGPGSPMRRFDFLQSGRRRAVLGLDAVFVDPTTRNMERRGHGQLLDSLESKVLSATLRRAHHVEAHLPHQPDPVIWFKPERDHVLAHAADGRVATVFPIGASDGLETLSHYELVFERDSGPRERAWTAALVLLSDLWCLEAERRRRSSR